jgi:cysteine-rich repeat protein
MLQFEFPLDATLHPSSYQSAAITNLFYWNNALHDILYQYGFDEAAGNFQENNYGNGGLGSDPVQADAQDGSDINNAQFGTPPDGQDPRMEMFLFTQSPGPLLQVTTPALIAGNYAASGGTFGGSANGLSGTLVQALDPADAAGPATTDACSPLTNAGAVAGNIALVDRGTCLFVEKTATVQAAGAIGIVIVNNAGDGLVNMGGTDPSLVIPPLFIGQTNGNTIKAQLGGGVTAVMTAPVPRGSSFDNGVIAHEYAHGLSNRLTGGAANSGCLNTTQSSGMGEGWSDWLALMVTATSTDTALDPKAIGTYALGEPPTGPGFRNFPYSRDLSVTPLTLSDIATLNRPHGIGEVWASALYDLYWNLVDHYGFQPDLLARSGGNGLLMELVIDAMKLQPCDPNFLEARDALLLAETNLTSAANSCLVWEAFARRGMGVSATSGSSTSTSVSEAFDEPLACQNECGDGLLQPGEQCDDGGNASFDGCTANCRDETRLPGLGGTATGGSVSVTIDGVLVQVVTSAGQTGDAVAAALAAAINANTALQGVHVVADSQGNRTAISGNLDSFVIDDPGFAAVPVPALGAAGQGLLAVILIGLAARMTRRRRTRTSSSPSS